MLLINKKQIKAIIINKHLNNRSGLSLIEAMIGIVIFSIIFVFAFKAFAPTATASHNLLRGTTIAMNACNWYLNTFEKDIQNGRDLEDFYLGENDITNVFLISEDKFSDINLLRSLKATSDITLEDNLYTVKIAFEWGENDNGKEKKHHFEMTRMIVQPDL